MDLVEFKKYQSILMRIGFFVAMIALSFPMSVFIINSFQINLKTFIGFDNNITSFIIFMIIVAVVLTLFYELIVALIFSYFRSTRMFFNEQRAEVKFILRLAVFVRTIILAILYVLSMYYHSLFNYFSVFELISTFVGCLVFYFVAKNQFGGYAVAAYIFKQTAKVFFFLEIVTIAFDIGGILVL